MVRILPRPTNRGGKAPPLTFYEKDLLARYERARYQPIPYEQAAKNFNQAFLEGLTGIEKAMLSRSDCRVTDTMKQEIRVHQRARLLARQLGIEGPDVA